MLSDDLADRPLDITFGDTVAAVASSVLFVLGSERKPMNEVEPRDVEMTKGINGQVVSRGNGAACLGDPLNAVAWLMRRARTYGEPLRAAR